MTSRSTLATRSRRLLSVLALLALVLPCVIHAAHGRQDVGTMPAAEVAALQRCLEEARYCKGSIDRRASDANKQTAALRPDQRPKLHVGAGMHVAGTRRISKDAAFCFDATIPDDKTVELWLLPEERALRTSRWPLGNGGADKPLATVASPDEHLNATSGYDAGSDLGRHNGIPIFNVEIGAAVGPAAPTGSVTNQLAWSVDGHWIAAIPRRQGRGVDIRSGESASISGARIRWQSVDDALSSPDRLSPSCCFKQGTVLAESLPGGCDHGGQQRHLSPKSTSRIRNRSLLDMKIF